MKGKLANGVGSQYSHTTSEGGVSSITNADAHTSAEEIGWTDSPTDLNRLIRLGERRTVVSARVPSDSPRALPLGKKVGIQWRDWLGLRAPGFPGINQVSIPTSLRMIYV